MFEEIWPRAVFLNFLTTSNSSEGCSIISEYIVKIRREHFVHGKSIKSIVRDQGVARNTVRKVLRSGETAFSGHRDVSRVK